MEAWVGINRVFTNLNLNLNLKENTVILGPNGSGKSSLIKLINRSIYPVIKNSSSFKLFGKENINLWDLRSRVGFVSNELGYRIYGKSSVFDVIHSGYGGSYGHPSTTSRTNKSINECNELINTLGLWDLKDKFYSELSDGQKRTSIIGRALIHKPNVLVLDEPTSGLDIKSKYQFLNLLGELCLSDTTILLVTHSVECIFEQITRVILLKSGSIIGDGQTHDILNSRKLGDLYETNLQLLKSNGYWQIVPAKRGKPINY